MDARMLCGQDVRRSGIWPTDESRIETFLARYGGQLEAGPVGDAAIMLRWTNGDKTQCVTGVTAQDALTKLQAEVA
jgi:hypothetical protein